MTLAPPSTTGAVHETVDFAFSLEVAVTAVGASGTTAGVAGLDGAEAMPVLMALVAVTVKV